MLRTVLLLWACSAVFFVVVIAVATMLDLPFLMGLVPVPTGAAADLWRVIRGAAALAPAGYVTFRVFKFGKSMGEPT